MKTGKVQVYVGGNGGTIFEYTISAESSELFDQKAREHGAQIIESGYRSSQNKGELVFYPPHRIFKVKIVSDDKELLQTNYPDSLKHT